MTHYSRALYKYPDRLSREALEHYELKNEHVGGLGPVPDRLGPYELSAWAERNGLEVFYVDICWCRVPVTSDQLRLFYREHLGPLPASREEARIIEGQMYLLEAEEF